MVKNIVEIGMLCKEPLDYYLDLLKNNGINQKMVLVTRDIYFYNKDINELKNLKESDIKHSCIRIRMCRKPGGKFRKFNIQNCNMPGFKSEYRKWRLKSIEKKLLSNGYKPIIDTVKTDYQYENGIQLQNVDDIGLLVFWDNPKYYDFNEEKQFDLLKKDLEKIGFDFVYPLGIDRLRTKINNKLCFSKNQSG